MQESGPQGPEFDSCELHGDDVKPFLDPLSHSHSGPTPNVRACFSRNTQLPCEEMMLTQIVQKVLHFEFSSLKKKMVANSSVAFIFLTGTDFFSSHSSRKADKSS